MLHDENKDTANRRTRHTSLDCRSACLSAPFPSTCSFRAASHVSDSVFQTRHQKRIRTH